MKRPLVMFGAAGIGVLILLASQQGNVGAQGRGGKSRGPGGRGRGKSQAGGTREGDTAAAVHRRSPAAHHAPTTPSARPRACR